MGRPRHAIRIRLRAISSPQRTQVTGRAVLEGLLREPRLLLQRQLVVAGADQDAVVGQRKLRAPLVEREQLVTIAAVNGWSTLNIYP